MKLDELIKYIEENIDEGDFIEIHIGRAFVEGYLVIFEKGYIKLKTEKFGDVEFNLEEIYEDLLEFVHIKDGERKVIEFY
ncbi:DUF2097 family protein [Methanocaldococcus infernus]|uniref:Uncharacterized protein n=1 Tax=Methanocaldococcus infernus (strain DSM 11812 / JCM 15783 / ME) TaxID=573063 RepID=D5VR95_METIM|nr:DUF2097 family protein [Methanocaldococcus infernus]ADG13098.1 Protein of unknown function DUF2097 [Methanocaldococcus infernus ME]